MNYFRSYLLIAKVILCGFLLQSCRQSLHVTPEESVLRGVHKQGGTAQDFDQVLAEVTVAQSSDLLSEYSNVQGTRLSAGTVEDTPTSSLVPVAAAASDQAFHSACAFRFTHDVCLKDESESENENENENEKLDELEEKLENMQAELARLELSEAFFKEKSASLEQACKELQTALLNSEASQAVLQEKLAKSEEAYEQLQVALSHQALAWSGTFGVGEWEQYFGEVNEVPQLPADIDKILASPCPFWLGRKVKDTHLLVLIPSAVNGELFTLNLLGKLIKMPKNRGYKTQYDLYDIDTQRTLGDCSPDRSYWVLMTREVLPASRSKTCKDQQLLIAEYAREAGIPYVMPHVLEAATVILSHYVRSGERLYPDNPWTYTRCQELVGQLNYPVVVGGFSLTGLRVYDDDGYIFSAGIHGVAGLRRL
jgi:actin-related protein